MASSRQVLLTGGGPWGVKLTGGKDFCSPLLVSKVLHVMSRNLNILNSLMHLYIWLKVKR